MNKKIYIITKGANVIEKAYTNREKAEEEKNRLKRQDLMGGGRGDYYIIEVEVVEE